jgi:hypothetical protein
MAKKKADAAATPTSDSDLNHALHRPMRLQRRCEERTAKAYALDQHRGLGQQ